MHVLCLVWGILALLGLGVAFLPCLGSLNWLNIPFAVLGGVVCLVAQSKVTPEQQKTVKIGLVLCAIAVVLGGIRLILGGGIL